jgi:hypothetical protein
MVVDKIRQRVQIPKGTTAIFSFLFLTLGILMGAMSKCLDTVAVNELPRFLRTLDISNFLGRFAVWVFIAVAISIYTKSPVRAAIYVFLFFVGMVSSYYLYSKYVAGFFPKSYALVWFALTLISPLLSFAVWFAKGQGPVAVAVGAVIVGAMFQFTFAYGLFYIDVIDILELILFILILFMLRRNKKETLIMIVAGIFLAIVFNAVSPIQFH